LMKFVGRRSWRTVTGGSRAYVRAMAKDFRGQVLLNAPVRSVRRLGGEVLVTQGDGTVAAYDQVVIAAHAPQALAMLSEPRAAETEVLGAFAYTPNRAVLHGDRRLLPKRRAAWSSWNHMGRRSEPGAGGVTYWMNHLQSLSGDRDLFVSLNPEIEPDPALTYHSDDYEHPVFNAGALQAQSRLWSLQGAGGVWFCGAYFGAGFHEDGLQSGLAVAEQLGGVRRPWTVAGESDRIVVTTPARPSVPPLLGQAA